MFGGTGTVASHRDLDILKNVQDSNGDFVKQHAALDPKLYLKNPPVVEGKSLWFLHKVSGLASPFMDTAKFARQQLGFTDDKPERITLAALQNTTETAIQITTGTDSPTEERTLSERTVREVEHKASGSELGAPVDKPPLQRDGGEERVNIEGNPVQSGDYSLPVAAREFLLKLVGIKDTFLKTEKPAEDRVLAHFEKWLMTRAEATQRVTERCGGELKPYCGSAMESFSLKRTPQEEESGNNSPVRKLWTAFKAETHVQGEATTHGILPRGGNMNDVPVAEATENWAKDIVAGESFIGYLGRSSMHQAGCGGTGINKYFPQMQALCGPAGANAIVAGGSSTGAWLLAGIRALPAAEGSDGGGSLRIGACLNGVVGFKATSTFFDKTGGAYPNGEHPYNDIVALGCTGKTVFDLSVLALEMTQFLPNPGQMVRYGALKVAINYSGLLLCEPTIAEAFLDVVKVLEEGMRRVEPSFTVAASDLMDLDKQPGNDRAKTHTHMFLFGSLESEIPKVLSEKQKEGMSIELKELTEMGKTFGKPSAAPMRERAEANTKDIRNRMNELKSCTGIDLLIQPTLAIRPPTIRKGGGVHAGAYKHGSVNLLESVGLSKLCTFANIGDRAEISLPYGEVQGYPFGISIMALDQEPQGVFQLLTFASAAEGIFQGTYGEPKLMAPIPAD